MVRRQPSNPYDSNAIAIENVQNVQIGHIPRLLASKLAKYMDNGSLLVEGSLAGQVGTFDCSIALKLFGTSDPIERANVRLQMKGDRLPCQVIDQDEKEAKKRKQDELKRVAAAKKVSRGGRGGFGTGVEQWNPSQGEWVGGMAQGNELSSFQNLEDIIETAQKFNPREMGKHLFILLFSYSVSLCRARARSEMLTGKS